MAVAVEFIGCGVGNQPDCDNPLFLDSHYPMDKSSLALRNQRIQEAIDYLKSQGVRPIIYTYQNAWSRLTGNATSFASQGVPLWDSKPDYVDNLGTTVPYGGWTSRGGKQYVTTDLPNQQLDLDIFESSLFPNP
jgi:hypothetical protein